MKPGVTVYMKVIKAVWNWKQLKRSREQESKRELSLGAPIITYRVKGRMEKQPSGVTIIIIIGGAGIVILDQDFCSVIRDRELCHQKRLMKDMKEKMEMDRE